MARPFMSYPHYLSIKAVDDRTSKKKATKGRRVSEMSDSEWVTLKQQGSWLETHRRNPRTINQDQPCPAMLSYLIAFLVVELKHYDIKGLRQSDMTH